MLTPEELSLFERWVVAQERVAAAQERLADLTAQANEVNVAGMAVAQQMSQHVQTLTADFRGRDGLPLTPASKLEDLPEPFKELLAGMGLDIAPQTCMCGHSLDGHDMGGSCRACDCTEPQVG